MPQAPKNYHHDYYYGPVGMTEHDDWRQANEDVHNQRPPNLGAHASREPIHVTDEELREKISVLLQQDSNVDLNDVEVAVEMGEVTLSGTVTSRWIKQKVVSGIAGISGVKDVEDSLQVDRPADREIA